MSPDKKLVRDMKALREATMYTAEAMDHDCGNSESTEYIASCVKKERRILKKLAFNNEEIDAIAPVFKRR